MKYFKPHQLISGQLFRITSNHGDKPFRFMIYLEHDDWTLKLFDQLTSKYFEVGTSKFILSVNKSGFLNLDPSEPVWNECTVDLEETFDAAQES